MDKTTVILSYASDFRLPEDLAARLRDGFPTVEFREGEGGECPAEWREAATVFVGWPSDAALRTMPNLRWVQLPSAGADRYVGNDAVPAGAVVTTASGVFGVPGAEHAIALMMALTRHIHTHVRQQARREWKQNPRGLEVQDSTVAVLGLGDIGTETAKRAKGLGARVLAVKRTTGEKPDYVDALYTMDALDDVLARADFVIAALPGTEETRGLFDVGRIAKMKNGAVFINVGRGSLVDEDALLAALQSGKLEGAGLDVTAQEPLPPESPLWDQPNVIITSHSVNTSPRKALRRVALLEKNLALFLDNQPLLNRVDRGRGY